MHRDKKHQIVAELTDGDPRGDGTARRRSARARRRPDERPAPRAAGAGRVVPRHQEHARTHRGTRGGRRRAGRPAAGTVRRDALHDRSRTGGEGARRLRANEPVARAARWRARRPGDRRERCATPCDAAPAGAAPVAARRQPQRPDRGPRRTCSRSCHGASWSRSSRSDNRRSRPPPRASRSHSRKAIPMALTKDQWVDEIKGMTVLDLAELVKALEEEFGVSAAAAPVAAAAPAAGGGGGEAAAAEEQTEFDVILNAAGEKKIQVIKVVRAVTGPRPQGGEGRRRRGPRPGQGRHHARGGRQDQGRAGRGGSDRRGEVAPPRRFAAGRLRAARRRFLRRYPDVCPRIPASSLRSSASTSSTTTLARFASTASACSYRRGSSSSRGSGASTAGRHIGRSS